MAKADIRFKHINPDYWTELKAELDKFPDIALGFPKSKAGSIQYPEGISLADVAFKNNYGDENNGHPIPPRPFMNAGSINAVTKTRNFQRSMFKAIQEKKIGAVMAADLMGAKFQFAMRKTIIDWQYPPNAPFTVQKKGFDDPLIETGLLNQSVTWELRKKKVNNDGNPL